MNPGRRSTKRTWNSRKQLSTASRSVSGASTNECRQEGSAFSSRKLRPQLSRSTTKAPTASWWTQTYSQRLLRWIQRVTHQWSHGVKLRLTIRWASGIHWLTLVCRRPTSLRSWLLVEGYQGSLVQLPEAGDEPEFLLIFNFKLF